MLSSKGGQEWGKSPLKDGAISSGSGKAHRGSGTSSAERVVLGQPDASPVLMPLWCLYHCQGWETEKWVGSAPGLFLSFFLFLASGLCLGCFSSVGWYWSAVARQPLGESGIDTSGWSTKRSLRSSWAQARGFTGGGKLHPAKYAATGSGTKQPRTCRDCGRNGYRAPQEVGCSVWPFSPKKTAPAGRDLTLLRCLKCDCIYMLRKTHKAAN